MVLLITQERASPGVIVSAATLPFAQGLLTASDAAVACYRLPPPPTAAAAAAAEPEPQRLWQQPVSGGRVELAVPLAPDCQAYLLVTSHGAAAPAQAAVVQVLGDSGGGTVHQQQWQLGSGQPRHHICAQLDLACNVRQEEPPVRPTFSGLVHCGGGTAFMLAASLHEGTVHVLRVERGPGGIWRLDATPNRLSTLQDTELGAAVVAESLALGPASGRLGMAAGRLQVAILYSSHSLGGGGHVKHMAWLELPAGETALHRCCWLIRNVHPSTSLVAALPGARTLVAAANGFTLLSADAPQDKQLVAARLQGRPTCAAALSESAAVVGDSSGQLTLLDLERLTAVPVATGLLPAAPSCLAFLPAAAAAAGVLFAGCSSGGGVFLEVPPEAAFAGAPSAVAAAQWQVVGGGDAAPLAANLAPVVDCKAIPDPSGCGDMRLLMCCGAAPFSRLALGHLAANLAPLAVGGGDELPVQARLLGLKASPAAARHCYLLLSSDNGGSGRGFTAVLKAGGDGLQAATLPGLQLEEATLLAGPLQGGCMFQATSGGVQVFKPSTGAAVGTWQPPGGGPITLAAQQGQYIAAACGALVQVLHCTATGRLQEEQELTLPQQASALALFQLGSEVWLAVGLWLSNEVRLQPLSAEQPACRLDLGACQPRSLLVAQLGGSVDSSHGDIGGASSDGGSSPGSSGCGSPTGGASGYPAEPRTVLVVGTGSGEVLWQRLHVQLDAFGGSSGIRLEPCGWVRAGVAPVSLQLVPPDPAAAAATAWSSSGSGEAWPCILALSDQALLLHPDPVHPARLAAARMHGGEGLTAACPLLVPELPGSRLAYVDPSGQLCIGALDTELRLHADQLALSGGAEATAATFDAASGCAAVACVEPGGGSSLRLVDAAAMRELARLPMGAGQSITAVASLSLPCSSVWNQHSSTAAVAAGGSAAAGADTAAAQQQQQPGCKSFMVVAVSVDSSSSTARRLAAEQLPTAADSRQPWWRQQQQQGSSEPPGSSEEQQGGKGAGSSPQQGQLLVFEVRLGQLPQVPAAGGGNSSGEGADRLVLHGRCPLPTAVFSLATVQPEVQPLDVSGPAGTRAASPRSRGGQPAALAAQLPLLAAGCHDGTVRLYRVYVDDAGVEGKHAVEQGLAAIAAAVPPVRLVGASPQLAAEDGAAGGSSSSAAAAAAAGLGARRPLWCQHVAMQLVAKAPTCFEGIPASLEAQGSTLFARDLLASLTAFRVQPVAMGEAPSLLPLTADLSGRHVTAMLALSEAEVLAGVAGGRLLLFQRDPAAERDRQAAARQRWELVRELGGNAEAADGQQQQPAIAGGRRYVPTLRDAVPLDAPASHETSGSVAAVMLGLLGVPLRQLEELNSGTGGGAEGQVMAATVVSTSGAVGSARLLSLEQHRVLRALAAAAEATCYCDRGDGSGGAHKLTVGAVEGAAAPGGCVDGGALTAAFLQPAWHARLLKAAPAAVVQRGRAILESFGLL